VSALALAQAGGAAQSPQPGEAASRQDPASLHATTSGGGGAERVAAEQRALLTQVNDAKSLLAAQVAQYRAEAAQYRAESEAVGRYAIVLIGLGSLYAIALAAAQYVSVERSVKRAEEIVTHADSKIKDAAERSKESADRVDRTLMEAVQRSKDSAEKVDRTLAELLQNYPMMQGLGAALTEIVAKLNRLLDDTEESDIEIAYRRLGVDDRFEILMVERLLPIYDHFSGPAPSLSEMFRGVGRFYLGRFRDAKLAQRRGEDVTPMEDDLRRARYYLQRAIRFDSRNYAAMNDAAVALDELKRRREAIAYYEASLREQPKQQRALYNLAYAAYEQAREHADTGHVDRAVDGYREAERLITEALGLVLWERHQSGRRVCDLHYNRACFRSRLGEITGEDSFADGSVDDLTHSAAQPTDELRSALRTDLTGDLQWIYARRGAEIDEIAKRMGAT
jgi:tetratricopeptide (TPR) repeat protein